MNKELAELHQKIANMEQWQNRQLDVIESQAARIADLEKQIESYEAQGRG
jgi:hypothetical protein